MQNLNITILFLILIYFFSLWFPCWCCDLVFVCDFVFFCGVIVCLITEISHMLAHLDFLFPFNFKYKLWVNACAHHSLDATQQSHYINFDLFIIYYMANFFSAKQFNVFHIFNGHLFARFSLYIQIKDHLRIVNIVVRCDRFLNVNDIRICDFVAHKVHLLHKFLW